MHGKDQVRSSIFRTIAHAATVALAIAIVLALSMVLSPSAQGQTFNVIHTFTGGQDGGYPYAGLTLDRAGNLYGTASYGGGGADCGTVFKLVHKSSSWLFSQLYSFAGYYDACGPSTGVIFGPDGSLYGTTGAGGQASSGTAYNLRPAAHALPNVGSDWTETVLWSFGQTRWDSLFPDSGLVFQAGNMYGTAFGGGGVTHRRLSEPTRPAPRPGTGAANTPQGLTWPNTMVRFTY